MLVTFKDVSRRGTRTTPMQDTVDTKSIVRFHEVKTPAGNFIGTKLYLVDGSSILVGNDELEVMCIMSYCGEIVANAVHILAQISRGQSLHPSIQRAKQP